MQHAKLETPPVHPLRRNVAAQPLPSHSSLKALRQVRDNGPFGRPCLGAVFSEPGVDQRCSTACSNGVSLQPPGHPGRERCTTSAAYQPRIVLAPSGKLLAPTLPHTSPCHLSSSPATAQASGGSLVCGQPTSASLDAPPTWRSGDARWLNRTWSPLSPAARSRALTGSQHSPSHPRATTSATACPRQPATPHVLSARGRPSFGDPRPE